MNTQDLPLVLVEDVGGKASVRLEHLATQHTAYSVILLGHVSNCFSSSIHDDISVGLFESEEDVHHLDLSLNDQRAVVQEIPCRVVWCQNTIGVIWDCDRRNQI